MLKDDLYPLDLYTEFDQFVESQGEMFCMRESCAGCKYESVCEREDSVTFKNSVIPVRDIVRTDNTPMNYSSEISEENIETPYRGGRFEGNTIPCSNIRVFKKIVRLPEKYKDREIDHIVFQAGAYYCVKQRCSRCQYKDKCEVELEVVKDKDRIVVFDAKAQEPRSFLLSTKITNNIEKVWLDTFQNDSIREQPEYSSWELMFKHSGVDVESEIYKRYTDKTLFYDRTLMYKLQDKIIQYFNTKSDKNKEALNSYINEIISDFKEYESEVIA